MKKRIILVVAIVLIAVIATVLIGIPPLHSPESGGSLTYDSGSAKLTNEETQTIAAILRRCKPDSLFAGEYACGYSEDLAFSIGSSTYYLAQDSCNAVQDAATGRYYHISEEDADILRDIFRSHGAFAK